MNRIDTEVEGVCIIEPKVFGDNRGWFFESYSVDSFAKIGIDTVFVQDNRSYSAKKRYPERFALSEKSHVSGKACFLPEREIMDVAVDIRKGSPTYMKHVCVILSAENKRMLYIPKGCLHGFVALTDDVELSYKVDELYCPADDRSIKFDDPEIGVEWGVTEPVLSEKDKNAPLLCDSDVEFYY